MAAIAGRTCERYHPQNKFIFSCNFSCLHLNIKTSTRVMIKTILLSISLLSSIFVFSQSTDTTSNIDDNAIYEVVDTVASFPGGKPAWGKFVERNLDPNVGVENGANKGTYKVKIKFTVTKDGTLQDFEPLTKFKHGFEEEAIRVLKLSQKWIPAKKNGLLVNSKVVQEQVFVIMVF